MSAEKTNNWKAEIQTPRYFSGTHGINISGENSEKKVAIAWGATLEEAQANANAIAAVSELLDVCLGMADLIDRCGLQVNADFDQALRAAITKAEGRA